MSSTELGALKDVSYIDKSVLSFVSAKYYFSQDF